MYCNKCGFFLPDDSAFCSKCGNKLNFNQNVVPTNEILADSLPYEGMPVFTTQRSQEEEYMYFLRRNESWYLPAIGILESGKPSGRSPRKDFILYNMYITTFQVIMIPILSIILGGILQLSESAISISSIIFFLPTNIYFAIIGVRRCHDVNSSGIPYVILTIALTLCNYIYGVFYFATTPTGVILNLVYLFTLIYLTFVSSHKGKNKYGENPYGE